GRQLGLGRDQLGAGHEVAEVLGLQQVCLEDVHVHEVEAAPRCRRLAAGNLDVELGGVGAVRPECVVAGLGLPAVGEEARDDREDRGQGEWPAGTAKVWHQPATLSAPTTETAAIAARPSAGASP